MTISWEPFSTIEKKTSKLYSPARAPSLTIEIKIELCQKNLKIEALGSSLTKKSSNLFKGRCVEDPRELHRGLGIEYRSQMALLCFNDLRVHYNGDHFSTVLPQSDPFFVIDFRRKGITREILNMIEKDIQSHNQITTIVPSLIETMPDAQAFWAHRYLSKMKSHLPEEKLRFETLKEVFTCAHRNSPTGAGALIYQLIKKIDPTAI